MCVVHHVMQMCIVVQHVVNMCVVHHVRCACCHALIFLLTGEKLISTDQQFVDNYMLLLAHLLCDVAAQTGREL